MKLTFISKTFVQLGSKYYPDITFTMDSSATYTICESNIKITYNAGVVTGAIDGNTMTLADSGNSVKFIKQ